MNGCWSELYAHRIHMVVMKSSIRIWYDLNLTLFSRGAFLSRDLSVQRQGAGRVCMFWLHVSRSITNGPRARYYCHGAWSAFLDESCVSSCWVSYCCFPPVSLLPGSIRFSHVEISPIYIFFSSPAVAHRTMSYLHIRLPY